MNKILKFQFWSIQPLTFHIINAQKSIINSPNLFILPHKMQTTILPSQIQKLARFLPHNFLPSKQIKAIAYCPLFHLTILGPINNLIINKIIPTILLQILRFPPMNSLQIIRIKLLYNHLLTYFILRNKIYRVSIRKENLIIRKFQLISIIPKLSIFQYLLHNLLT